MVGNGGKGYESNTLIHYLKYFNYLPSTSWHMLDTFLVCSATVK